MADKLPESLDWYRDIFKWFVALASGLLAFVVSVGKDHPTDRLWLKIAVCVLFFAFGLAGALSAFACVWIVDYANHRENAQAASEAGKNVDEANKKLTSTLTKLRRLYQWALWTFSFALVLTAMLYSFAAFLPEAPKPKADCYKKVPCNPEVTAAAAERTTLLFVTEIGPFPSGSAILKAGCTLRPEVTLRLKELGPRINYLLLIGSADWRRVKGETSNRKLAEARARWTGDCIKQQLAHEDLTIVRLLNGPTNLATYDQQLLAEDRMIQIYADIHY